MWADPALLGACLGVAILIALPAVLAGRRRLASRELSDVANALIAYAAAVRNSAQPLPCDAALMVSS